MLGELSGKIRSTPTPYEILRTVNVDREPFETRRMHTPSNACRRVFSPSRIFAHTLIESPRRNSGRPAGRRCAFSMDSRIPWTRMATIPEKVVGTQGSARDPPRASSRATQAQQFTTDAQAPLAPEQAVQDDRASRADRQMIPVGRPLDRRKHARHGRNQPVGEAPAGPEQDQQWRGAQP